MAEHLAIGAPLILPLAAAIALIGLWRYRTAQRVLNVVASCAYLALTLWLLAQAGDGTIRVAHVGNWPAPFGISLVLDRASAWMLAITGLVVAPVSLFGAAVLDTRRERFGFHPVYQFLLVGVSGAFLTGDLFNLFVWFELTLIASFVLLTLGGERGQIEGGFKYVVLNLIASSLFLAALGLLYGLMGTLNMADLARRLPENPNPALAAAVTAMLTVAFGIKAAVFPLFFWLPSSYHTPAPVVSALFAGVLTKVGVFALWRCGSLVFASQGNWLGPLLLVLAIPTMLVGVLGAVSQKDFRRILAFHSISQVGYMVAGVGLLSVGGLGASLLFMAHHALVKTALFLVAGAVWRLRGTYSLDGLGGLWPSQATLATLFLTAAMALVGIPPASGFIGKLAVLRAAFEPMEALPFVVGAAALVTGLFTLLSMLKVWNYAFWRQEPEGCTESALSPLRQGWVLASIGFLVVCAVGLGLAAGPASEYVQAAGVQALDSQAMQDAVLGRTP